MYIRRTSIKSRKDGSHYYSYRLVESKRTEKGARQYTLLNLGANFALPREQWPELTKQIESILNGQQSLLDIEQLAQSYASRIIASYQEVEHLDGSDYREVALDSLEMSQPRSIGAEHIAFEALQLLGLDRKFKELGFNENLKAILSVVRVVYLLPSQYVLRSSIVRYWINLMKR